MNREGILAHLHARPAPGPARVDYFHRIYGQITGWIAEVDRQWMCDHLPEIALAYPREMRIVEVGTFGGGTARGLVAMTGGRITCTDNWSDFHPDGADGGYCSHAGCATGPEFFWTILGKKVCTADPPYMPDLSGCVDELITGDSRAVGSAWSTPIDLLLVDGDHSYEVALADIKNFGRHVVPGGVILVDDYDMPPVASACEEALRAPEWETLRGPPAKLVAYRRT